MVLELRLDASHVRVVEEYSDRTVRIPTGTQNTTAQKDDPRVMQWGTRSPTPGSLNASLSAQGNVYSHFYMPGVRVRARSNLPPDIDTLSHAGGLSNIGELGMVHRGDMWESLNFTEAGKYPDDVKLLDLLTLPYPYEHDGLQQYANQKTPSPHVLPGRININTAPPEILLGLNWDPMFEELASYGLRVASGLRLSMIEYLVSNRPYENLAHLAEVMARFPPFLNAPEGAQEAFLRYNANLITTKSSVFKVTVLAEAFDRRRAVVASRKLEAVVDRGHTPGSLGRPGEDKPTSRERSRAETARVLYFQWVAGD